MEFFVFIWNLFYFYVLLEKLENILEKQVYAIIKELHKAIEVEQVADLCDRVVQMLKR